MKRPLKNWPSTTAPGNARRRLNKKEIVLPFWKSGASCCNPRASLGGACAHEGGQVALGAREPALLLRFRKVDEFRWRGCAVLRENRAHHSAILRFPQRFLKSNQALQPAVAFLLSAAQFQFTQVPQPAQRAPEFVPARGI